MKIFLFAILQFASLQLYAQPQKFTYNVKPAEVGFDEQRLARLDSFILQNIKNSKVPNTITFIAKDGKVFHHKAHGWKNIEKKEKADVKTIFRNASQTKAITTVAAMILFERGYFQLNDPLSKYLPEFKKMQVIDTLYSKDTTYLAHPAQGEITIKHLMAHTSGIIYDSPISFKSGIPFFNSLKPEMLKDVVAKIAKFPLAHEPGKKFTYGLNSDVLGYLVEVLSGKPLDVFFKEEIFKPLGMVDTYFYLPKEKHDRLVELYQFNEKQQLTVSTSNSNRNFAILGAQTYFSGGAGLVGTIEDYAKFCQMLLNEGSFNNRQLLSRKTIQTMTTNQIGENYIWDNENKFGLGFELITEKGISSYLGSVGAYRWGGMYTTEFMIDPKEKLIVLFYTNVNPNSYWHFNSINKTLMYQALK